MCRSCNGHPSSACVGIGIMGPLHLEETLLVVEKVPSSNTSRIQGKLCRVRMCVCAHVDEHA